MPGRLVAGRRELFFPRADGRETVSVRNRVSKHLGGWLRARGMRVWWISGADQQDRENERRSMRNGEGESPKAG